MKLSEAVGKIKTFIWNAQDRWDAFKANPFETHLACAGAGCLIGIYLAFMVWHK